MLIKKGVQQAKTNRPVQTDRLSHTTSFLSDSSRALGIILIRRNGRFYLYRRTIIKQHNKILRYKHPWIQDIV